MDSPPNLPSDIIFETLSKTCLLKTLDTCKMVCKDWNQLIYESSFMPKYCKNTNNLYGYYIQNLKSCKYVQQFISPESSQYDENHTSTKVDKKFWEDDVKIEASSKQGILCVVKRKSQQCRYYICKPSTRQWQSLPNPKLKFSTVKVALIVLHSNPLRYKIVRISRDNHPQSIRQLDCCDYYCEIFDSKTWAWRRVNDMLLPYGVFFNQRNQSVHASGLIYWLTTDDYVVVFNHENYSYFRFPLPQLKNDHSSHHQLIEYEGKLGFICKTSHETIEIWVVNDSKNHTWRLVKEVKLDSSLERDHAIPGGLYNKDIALLHVCNKMVFYKLEDSSVKEIELGIGNAFAQHVFPFRSDLEPINLRGK